MKKNSAFTIYELIMVIVLVGIIFAVSAPLLIEIAAGWQLAQNRNDLSASAIVAMDRMVREIRQVGTTTDVITANAGTFEFIDVNGNTITYNLSGGYLMRTLNAVANELAANVSALTFTYYNSSGTVIATPVVSPSATNIARVVIDLTFTSGTTLYVESGVSPRSL